VSARSLAIDALLVVGVLCQLICCVGVLVARNAFDRLHYSGAATTLGPFCIGVAIVVRESVSAGGIQTIVTVLLMFLLNPVLVIATARAARRIDEGSLDGLPRGTRRPG
jgi:monovalent cation/proton antiporter MnhG/PhaG subunit